MWNWSSQKRDAASSDADEVDAKKAGRFRRGIRKTGRFIRFTAPSNPVKAEHVEALRLAKAAFSQDRPPCPICQAEGRHGVLLPVADDPNARECSDPDCGAVITLNELRKHNAPQLSYAPETRRLLFNKRAVTMFVVACLLVSVAALYSAYQRSTMMFFGGLIMSAPLFMSAFAFRYRAWQATTGRFYEIEAPLGEFIRDELRSLFSKGDK